MANFKEKFEKFIEEAQPRWHVAYRQTNFRLCGLWPKDPRISSPETLIPGSKVVAYPEDQLNLIDELFSQGIFKYRFNTSTQKIEPIPVEKTYSDFGEFVRIQFNNDMDESVLDAKISILLERKVFKVQLLSDNAKKNVENSLVGNDEETRIRFYITKYNNPNELITPIVLSANQLHANGEAEVEFDGSTLPEDISIYYIKIFGNVNFEVK
jgi:hypothetical protein